MAETAIASELGVSRRLVLETLDLPLRSFRAPRTPDLEAAKRQREKWAAEYKDRATHQPRYTFERSRHAGHVLA
jgi:hypothetical protein